MDVFNHQTNTDSRLILRKCQAMYSCGCSARDKFCFNTLLIPLDMDEDVEWAGSYEHFTNLIWEKATQAKQRSILSDNAIIVNFGTSDYQGVFVSLGVKDKKPSFLHIVQPSEADLEQGLVFWPFSCYTATMSEAFGLQQKFPGRIRTPMSVVIRSDQALMVLCDQALDGGAQPPTDFKLSTKPAIWKWNWCKIKANDSTQESMGSLGDPVARATPTGEAAPGDCPSGVPLSEDATPEHVLSGHTPPEDTLMDDTPSEDTLTEGTSFEDALIEDATPDSAPFDDARTNDTSTDATSIEGTPTEDAFTPADFLSEGNQTGVRTWRPETTEERASRWSTWGFSPDDVARFSRQY